MTSSTNDPARRADLRQRAQSRLTEPARSGVKRASPSEALAVLHALASSPDTAHDALALLHELQVHQVEIDLQNEELRAARAETEAALRRQTELYERAPMAYMTLDADLVLHELNATAARLLGGDPDGLRGQSLAALLAPGSAEALSALLARAAASGSIESSEWGLTTAATGATLRVLANAVADTAGGRCLLTLAAVDAGVHGAASAANER